ncbi:MAG: CPBP family intramembrane metalloprotease [Kiritimatiellaeota bacterium]|nr:CPBP family intramembrane metalloprotease [Kiritimatiellota bacterium]
MMSLAAHRGWLLAAAYDSDAGARLALVTDLRVHVLRKIWVGLLTAVVLYGVFWLGNRLLHEFLPLAANGIRKIYALQGDASTLRVALLIGLLFGPAEELVWRGAIQRALAERLGAVRGLFAATGLYAAAHLASGNPMLVLAALVCGLFWGALYQRTGSVLLVAINHAAWNLAVYLLLPFS